jgi:type IV secretion system protein VirD4
LSNAFKLGGAAVSAFVLLSTCAQAADTSYLKEMPSVAQVERDVRGADASDTAARQIAAFTILTRMADVRVGRPDTNLDLGSLTPPERQLLQSYRDAKARLYASTEATFDPNCNGTNCARVVFSGLLDKYELSPELRDQIEKRYFDRQWLSEYQRADAALAARIKQEAKAPVGQGSLPAGQTGVRVFTDVATIVRNLFWYLLFAGLFIWWRLRVRKQRRAQEQTLAEQKLLPERELNRQTVGELGRLGATVEERSARIEDLFNRKTESISLDANEYEKEGRWVLLKGKLVRSIAAMPPRERETLRAAYHLFNIGELKPLDFHLARLALLFGDGKAHVSDASFAGGNMIHDFAGAVKNYTGMTAESAVSTVLTWLEGVARRRPADPTVRLLAGRLLGGGDAALSSADEFAAVQDADSKAALILGVAENGGKVVTYTGEGSAITVAPPGSGKTQCHVFPTLLSWRGPAVVLDVKGEIYAGTSEWRKQNVGPVYKFAPLDPANSNGYNPLSPVRSNPDFLWEDSRFLADMMLVPSGGKDPFWENRARDVLTAAIARACLTDDPAKRSLADVLDIFHGVGWDPFIRELQARVDIRSLVRAGASLGEMERKTRDGVLQTGLSSLSAWDGERIERATRHSDWSPLDLRSGANPTIYICLKPNEVESYVSVLRVFIAQHIRLLTSALPPPGASPILFVLDELPRLRQMPPVEEALEIGRQYGIRLWMFTQSLGQLENAYPNAEGMVGSCAIRMYMNPSVHDGTAQKISDEIGFQEGVLDNTRQKIVEAPVLAGPEYKDFVLVMATGFKPFRLRKSFAYQDPVLKERMGTLAQRS